MEYIDDICLKCMHFRPFSGGCRAFPDGIPDEIGFANSHNEPVNGQKCDYVFTPGELDEQKEWLA